MDLVEIVGLVNLPTNLIVTFVPIASDPEGQLSNQSDIPANSEVKLRSFQKIIYDRVYEDDVV